MIWIGDKGRDIYNMWERGTDEAKKRDTYYTQNVCEVPPKSSTRG